MQRLLPILLTLILAQALFAQATQPWLTEQSLTWTTADGSVRINLNTPGDISPEKPTQLIIFALPNGNTIEQTLGCRLSAGMSWHYDIQHIAAQTRKLRELDPSENIILACVEAKGLSWPAWRKDRKDNGHQIRQLVSEIKKKCRLLPSHIALSAHSGGGSFIIGYLNGAADIAQDVDRIAFLDANYSYDDAEHHGDKLVRWLKDDQSHHLVVIAYDDRDVTYQGKKIVSDTGGTYRASHRMIDRFATEMEVPSYPKPPFEHYSAMSGQIEFFIHTNPEKKILHTRLVELNGFLQAMTLGTPMRKGFGEFFGERAYSDLIQPPIVSAQPAISSQVKIPPRPANAIGGCAFMKKIENLPLVEREAAIQKEVISGNIPEFLRKLVDVKVSGQGLDGRAHTGTLRVMPDVLAIGSDDDFVRIPMTPASATAIAKAFNMSMMTRKLSDVVYRAAAVKLEPKPLTENRELVATFVQHQQIIQQQLGSRGHGELVAGMKKDVVITPALVEKPKKVAIYGWHKLDGRPIQPLYTGHADYYVDYSHGIRLVGPAMIVDGVERSVSEVLKDPELCCLVSDEGPVNFSYSTVVRAPAK